MSISLSRLQQFLSAFPRLRIGLVGDLFLDRYLEIEASLTEISIETGLEAYQVIGVRNQPGALGTVMNNLAALGVGRLLPVTVIGDDGHGDDLLRALASLPCDTTSILRDGERLTPTYTKPMLHAAGAEPRELNRLDVRTREPLSAAMRAKLAEHIRGVFDRGDGLIVLDQISAANEGVVNAATRDVLRDLARQQPEKLVFIDSREFLGEFDFGVLKGNAAELRRAAGCENVEAAAVRLAARTGQSVFCTRGDQGLLIAQPDGRLETAAAIPVTGPIDIVGAGDSASAGIVTAMLAGATDLEAATLANLVASITIQQIGTTGTASPAQILSRWQDTAAN